jgi:hypothetical protein
MVLMRTCAGGRPPCMQLWRYMGCSLGCQDCWATTTGPVMHVSHMYSSLKHLPILSSNIHRSNRLGLPPLDL